MTLTHYKEPLSMDTSTLCFKGSAQIHAFIKFVSPFVEDITKGEAAKAEVVEYFLSNKDSYTNDVRTMLDSFMEQSGISRTYIFKVKKALEYRQQTTNAYTRVFIEEHPIGSQYLMSNVDLSLVSQRALEGIHFTKRELESFCSPGNTLKQKKLDKDKQSDLDMVSNTEYKYLVDVKAAELYRIGTRKTLMMACMQTLSDMNYKDPKLEKALLHLNEIINEVMSKPVYEN